MDVVTRGHVFIVQGDLLKLDCDAFAVSSDGSLARPSGQWRGQGVSAHVDRDHRARVDATRHVYRIAGPQQPATYVVPIAGTHRQSIDWYTSAIAAFLELAADDLSDATVPRRRKVPRLALPFLGADKGGCEARQGELLQRVLATLQRFVSTHAADVVLVLRESDAYDAAQAARRQLPDAWQGLSSAACGQADELAQQALRGELALFLGAGVSMGAGLPSWNALLDQLATEADIPRMEEYRTLTPLERAQFLEHTLATRPDEATPTATSARSQLAHRVAAKLRAHQRHGLAHALLAKLPVREVVTTNYDQLFEDAAQAACGPGGAPAGRDKALRVIPYDGPPERDLPWLMKLHGCTAHPEDIVLSRQSFLRYEARRAALAGLLAGLFVTRHVVFVGSSFSDDNVIRIIDEVMRLWEAGSRASGTPLILGTNLTVDPPQLRDELWRSHFNWIALDEPRTLDLFLDRMAASACTGAAYLFKPAFTELYTDEDAAAKTALEAFFAAVEGTPSAALRAAGQDLRARFGAPAGSPPSPLTVTPPDARPSSPERDPRPRIAAADTAGTSAAAPRRGPRRT